MAAPFGSTGWTAVCCRTGGSAQTSAALSTDVAKPYREWALLLTTAEERPSSENANGGREERKSQLRQASSFLPTPRIGFAGACSRIPVTPPTPWCRMAYALSYCRRQLPRTAWLAKG
jgi:hypothetical protein